MKSYDLTFWRLDLKGKANSNEKLLSHVLAPRPKGQS